MECCQVEGSGTEWNGMDWIAVELHGGKWTGIAMEWNGKSAVECSGVEWRRKEGRGFEWNGVECNVMKWNEMQWNGIEWNGREWNGIVK